MSGDGTSGGPAPLRVDADLTVEVTPSGPLDALAGETPDSVEVWSDDQTVTVDCPSFRAARSLLSGLDALPVAPDRIDDGLDAAGLGVRVRVRRATVATLGPGVTPRYRRLAGLVGAPEASVSLRGTLLGALRRLL